MRSLRPLLTSLLVLFVPALGVCGSLAPLTASASFCSVKTAPVESSCCPMEETAGSGGTSPDDCPLCQDDPVPASCHACDPGAALPSKKEGARTKVAPAAAPDVVVAVRVAHVTALPAVPLRLAVLAASPPLNLLHETFRK